MEVVNKFKSKKSTGLDGVQMFIIKESINYFKKPTRKYFKHFTELWDFS